MWIIVFDIFKIKVEKILYYLLIYLYKNKLSININNCY